MVQKRVLGVIGLGHVGAHVAYALAIQGIADELVLVDQNEQKLASEVQDLRDAVAYKMCIRDSSYIGRVAAVMLGSSETTFYTIAVYFGSVGIVKTRYTIPASLCADAVMFLTSAAAVRVLMG